MELSFIQDENAVEHIDGITYDFPYTMHERDLTGYTVPWHWHEELESLVPFLQKKGLREAARFRTISLESLDFKPFNVP